MKKLILLFLLVVSSSSFALERTFQADWSPPVAGADVTSVSVEWLSGSGALTFATRAFDPSVVQDTFVRDVNNGETVKFRVRFHNAAGASQYLDSGLAAIDDNPEPPDPPTSAVISVVPLP